MTAWQKVWMKLWAWWFYLVFAGTFVLVYPPLMLFLYQKGFKEKAHRVRRLWPSLMLPLLGIRMKVEYERELEMNQPYIFVPNHTSYLDIPIMMLVFKGYFHFMAKAELTSIPLFGHVFKVMDIPVKRGNAQDAYKAMTRATMDLKKKINLVIFPEGTVSMTPPKMLRFKNGAFRLAIDNQVPVVPVTFLDNWYLFHADDRDFGRPGTSRIIVHQPIETKGMDQEDIGRLKDQVYEVIEGELRKHFEF